MTIAHAAGLAFIGDGLRVLAWDNYNYVDTSLIGIGREIVMAAGSIVCANVLLAGLKVSVVTAACAGSLLFGTVAAIVCVAKIILNVCKIPDNNTRKLLECMVAIPLGAYVATLLAQKLVLANSFRSLLNISLIPAVQAAGLFFGSMVVGRVYNMVSQDLASDISVDDIDDPTEPEQL